MQISSRFTIAIHILICIETFHNDAKMTSDFLATSVNVNPVVIRKILQQLKNAEIVKVIRGSGGAKIAKPLNEITLLDIYRAVECVEEGNLFHFHEHPNPLCPVGNNIHNIMDSQLVAIQNAMENEMKSITVAEVMNQSKQIIKK